jgi:hypothetical protein
MQVTLPILIRSEANLRDNRWEKADRAKHQRNFTWISLRVAQWPPPVIPNPGPGN